MNQSNLSDFAWRDLRRFQNVVSTSELLMELHSVSEKHKANAVKQAEQIRLCLSLAKEYFDAAQTVSLTTKPVLLYYSIMNLALAEVLFKQTGESSLDFARDQHRHHGLAFTVGEFKPNDDLTFSATKLVAEPMLRKANGTRFGTFELWHKTARQHPAIGRSDDATTGTNRLSPLTIPRTETMPLINEKGITLAYCLQRMPSLAGSVDPLGLPSEIVRASIRLDRTNEKEVRLTYLFHPYKPETIKRALDQFSFPPALVPNVDIEERGTGAKVEFLFPAQSQYSVSLGDCYNWDEEQLFLHTKTEPLNEFGLFYVSLYILGNYARYFPDRWVKDIEMASPVCLIAEELVEKSAERFPVLALSELRQSIIIAKTTRVW
ncbi:MAG: YaaC family protein [Pseudomonadota bacterium]